MLLQTCVLFGVIAYSCCQALLGLDEGEKCKNSGDESWTCTTLKNCSHVDVRILRPSICRFHGRDPIICCPPKRMNKAEMNCKRVTKKICSSEDKFVWETKPPLVTHVIGGKPAQSRKYPALIGYGPADDKTWLCGGSIVSELWVLSAAHCTNAANMGVAKWARLGELDYATDADDARPQDRRIVRRINHPDYKPPQIYHDIALFKLDSPAIFDQYVAPICLQTTFEINEPKATVVGWGRTGFVEDVSNKLLEADISLIDHTECSRLFGSGDQSTPRGIDRMAMLCAGEKEGGKDACSGDSGGPLVVNQPGTCLKKQVGITSFGRDCGLPNTPGIYTRVSTYVPWIESIVWP